MGRSKKIGLDYFPLDIDAFQDIKIRKLIKYQSGKAFTVYALLLCIIYKDGYYTKWDNELPFIISEQTGFEEAYISEVIKSCLALGLFSKELFDAEGVLTSKGIQERYSYICRQIKRKCDFYEYSLISSEKNGISSDEIDIDTEKIQQKKRKEKENNNSLSNTQAREVFLPPDILEKPIDDLYAILLKSEIWRENVIRRVFEMGYRDFSVKDFERFLELYILKLRSEGKSSKSENDAKEHFSNWLMIELKKQEDEKRRAKTFSRAATDSTGKVVCGKTETGTDIQSCGTAQKDYSSRF